MTTETAFRMDCHGAALLAILHLPEVPSERGVVIVVGGPQYRVGSHRQFLLLARELAAKGIAVLRFDYRGMGDSDGTFRGFEQIDDDLAVAVDAIQSHVPGLREVVLWGLCDAAAGVLFHAHRNRQVTGVVLLNPWVRTEATIARTYLRHYYLRRLTDLRFWRTAILGRLRATAAIKSLIGIISQAFGMSAASDTHHLQSGGEMRPLPERMADALASFRGRVLLILSGQDLTAQEFEQVASSRRWANLLCNGRVTTHRLSDADHTFSRREWRDQVASWTRDWLVA